MMLIIRIIRQEVSPEYFIYLLVGLVSVISALRNSMFDPQTYAAHLLLQMSTGHSRCALFASRSVARINEKAVNRFIGLPLFVRSKYKLFYLWL